MSDAPIIDAEIVETNKPRRDLFVQIMHQRGSWRLLAFGPSVSKQKTRIGGQWFRLPGSAEVAARPRYTHADVVALAKAARHVVESVRVCRCGECSDCNLASTLFPFGDIK